MITESEFHARRVNSTNTIAKILRLCDDNDISLRNVVLQSDFPHLVGKYQHGAGYVTSIMGVFLTLMVNADKTKCRAVLSTDLYTHDHRTYQPFIFRTGDLSFSRPNVYPKPELMEYLGIDDNVIRDLEYVCNNTEASLVYRYNTICDILSVPRIGPNALTLNDIRF